MSLKQRVAAVSAFGVAALGVAWALSHSEVARPAPSVLPPAPEHGPPAIRPRPEGANGPRQALSPAASAPVAARPAAVHSLFNFCYRDASGALQLDGGRTAAACERVRHEVSAEGAHVGGCTPITLDAWRGLGRRTRLFSPRWTALHCTALGWKG